MTMVLGYLVGWLAGVATLLVIASIGWNSASGFVGLFFSLCFGVVAGLVVGNAVVQYFRGLKSEASRQAFLEGQRRREEQQRKKELDALAIRLGGLVSASTNTAARLPQLIRDSDRALDTAEVEFADGAFAPFWDAVESAATGLATFDNGVRQIIQNSNIHRTEAAALESTSPPFRLGMDTLPDATRTAHRMRQIVRMAQKNFQFATIYEQRKTNQLLVVGFSSLGQAINELGDRLETSLRDLASCITVAISDVATAQREATAAIVSELALSREQAADDASATRDHEHQERQMLDNIQRRRRPFPTRGDDGSFDRDA